jgi:hypothetical protein
MITVSSTPNPNAVKFTVGKPVGGPATFVSGASTEDPIAQSLLDLPGVTSIFMTGDFVTISKNVEAEWDEIVPAAQAILEDHFT